MGFFLEEFNLFFRELAANNNKEWFNDNRKRYELFVKNPFKEFILKLINEIYKYNPTILDSKKAIFRINNDIRFSRSKIIYKTHVGAVLSPNGTRDLNGGGFYIHFSPGECYVGGGFYKPQKNELYNLRKYIIKNLTEFELLLQDKNLIKYFKGFALSETNKIIPKEFLITANKQPLLFNKQFYFMHKIDQGNEFILQENLLKEVINIYKTLIPFQKFLENGMK